MKPASFDRREPYNAEILVDRHLVAIVLMPEAGERIAQAWVSVAQVTASAVEGRPEPQQNEGGFQVRIDRVNLVDDAPVIAQRTASPNKNGADFRPRRAFRF
jgi:hypothetical protein